jgi:hypothetical protein
VAALYPAINARHDLLQVQKLLALQRNNGGLIDLDAKTFQELLVGKSRPYSVFLVAGAPHPTAVLKPGVHLPVGRRQSTATPGARHGRALLCFRKPPINCKHPPQNESLADAKDLRSQGKLKLGQLVSDLKLVAKTFAGTHARKPSAGNVLFARMEFSKSKELFGRFVDGDCALRQLLVWQHG